jgi:murein DD-endopeptidase MepM/ murein hydrolase activator NlpD
LLVAGATSSVAQQEQPLDLALPLDCKFGETCFIQQYFDHDPSKGMKDYRCGPMTYDGHDGVDLRIPSMAAQQHGVSVLAAAAGVVKAVRDGIADVNVRAIGLDSVAGHECGNGVLIAHEGGWETLYCHMAKGSVLVREGEHVEAGTALGRVGLSGQTEFPHLHFGVSHNGAMVDPFAAGAKDACEVSHPLWSVTAAAALAYRSASVINYGFADETLSIADVELGRAAAMLPTTNSPVLVAFVRAIGLKAADVQSFTLRGPGGEVLAHNESPPLESNLAERFMYVGKRKSTAEWPRGTYEAEFEIRRDGATALSRRFSFDLH